MQTLFSKLLMSCIFLTLSLTASAQITWNISDIKQTENTINFKATAIIPDQLRLMGMTDRNSDYFAGSAISLFIESPKLENRQQSSTNVTPNGQTTAVVKSYDVYSKRASFDCSVSFDGLNANPITQLRLIYVRINANKKIETRSMTFCLENSKLKKDHTIRVGKCTSDRLIQF